MRNPPPAWPTYRTVILDKAAQDFIDANAINGSSFEAQWDGIAWLLCRKPTVGTARDPDEPNSYLLLVVAPDELAQTCEVWVLYSHDDGTVTIHGVEIVQENKDAE